MRIHSYLISLTAGVVMASGGGNAVAVAAPLEAVASFSVLADVVQNVGGEHVHVTSLVPPNGDPHEFEPAPDHAKAVKAAAVTFISGDGLETWFQRLAKASGATQKPVTVSEGIKTLTLSEGGKKIADPHVWNSVPNVMQWVVKIESALTRVDPANAADYQANAKAYTKRLQELDAYVRSKIDPTPVSKRKILTSHDAFGYFGKEYGVTFLSPIGVSTETEASAADIAKLINQIKKEKISVYFIENSTDTRLVRQIAGATGAQPGGELYPESLSGPDGPAPTYEKMVRFNADQMAKAFGK